MDKNPEEWIDVKDKLPEIGEKVIIKISRGRPKTVYYKQYSRPSGKHKYYFTSKNSYYTPQYWKPISKDKG